MKKISTLFLSATLIFSLAFSNQIVNTKANYEEEPKMTMSLNDDFTEKAITIESIHKAKSGLILQNTEIQPYSLTWAALLAFLLANYPTLQTMANNFVYGWQTRPGFGSAILSWAESQIKLHFETYTDGTSDYWYNISSGCVIHTRNTYLCPMSN